MPGPSEPKRMSPFLDLLVDELLQLWRGVSISIASVRSFNICTALLCFISDIPATRKVCGFLGFNARLRFSKCLKEFTCRAFGERTNFSVYDRENWVVRTRQQHLNSLENVRKAPSHTERRELERRMGVSWSVLCRLPYFDIVRSHLIDAQFLFGYG